MKNSAVITAVLGCFATVLAGANGNAASQNRDPTALALVNQALSLLNGGTALSDVTLQATVTYTAGSEIETGTATFEALGDTNELMTLNLTSGQFQEIHSANAGAWWGADGVEHPEAQANCWTDASWFFPGLPFTAISTNPQIGLVNLGSTTWSGQAANELLYYQTVSGISATGASILQTLSAEEVYLDPNSALPLAIDFNAYPDTGPEIALPMEVRFSNYQQVNGMSVPLHIQKFLQGSLLLDINVTSATVNSGIPQSTFNIPPVGGSSL